MTGLELSADNIFSEIVDMEECDQNDKNGNCSFPAKFEFDNARNKREPTGNYSLTNHFLNCYSSNIKKTN